MWAASALVVAALLAFSAVQPAAAQLELVVQGEPRSGARELTEVAAYLSAEIGQAVRVEFSSNPLRHWRRLTSGERPAMVLEDPHFADYRVTRAGYRIIAAAEERQAFSLAGAGFLLLDPMDLAGRPVAALSPPSLSTLQLLAFYSDAVRIPRIVEASSYRGAAERVYRNQAVAAVLPADQLAAYPELKEMLLMEELPGRAFSVAPDLAEALSERLAMALMNAAARAEGRRALVQLGVPGFVRGHREAYEGFSQLLEGTWGFRQIRP